MTCDGAGALALRRLRPGLHAKREQDEVGIMLSGHLFPLLLDAVQVGSKRRAEDSLGLGILDVNARSSGRTGKFTTRPLEALGRKLREKAVRKRDVFDHVFVSNKLLVELWRSLRSVYVVTPLEFIFLKSTCTRHKHIHALDTHDSY